ncbi:MAG: relaxase domain-containing protein [Gammaproteobacteria bacterium]|nr:relaxase domain-containing protein [Gammaproteobacteria bacterium]
MLSVYTIKSASDAMDYYKPQNYYLQKGEACSSWFGKGAEILGLEGSVNPKIFDELLYGRLPNGVVMAQTQKGLHHRPGYDLTFSAPKSVSILALVLGNEAVLNAHKEAIKETLSIIEEKYAASRKKTGGLHLEKTGNFLFALFQEIDSRAGDPQLHTHAFLMNVTQMLDQAWQTIFGDFVYDDKMICGFIYRSLLAQKLIQLGHILRFEANGLFEIEAISQKVIEIFSKRSEEIKEWMDTHGLTGAKAAQAANFQTRGPKQSLTAEEHKTQWAEGLDQAHSSITALENIVREAKERGPITLPDPYLMAQASVAMAIAHLSERQATFSFEQLIEASKLMSVLPASEGDFLKAIEEQQQNKTLVYVDGKRLSTPETMALERENAQRMQQSKGTVQAMLPGWIASLVVAAHSKAGPERETLKSLSQNTDQQMMVRSSVSIILESIFKSFDKISKNYGFYPRFLVQNTLRADSLKEKLGTEQVSNLEGFLSACTHRAAAEKKSLISLPAWLSAWDKRLKAYSAREIWIIEGPVSFKEMSELQKWSKHFGARLIFMQAGKSLSPALQSLESQGIRVLDVQAPAHYKEELTQTKRLLEGLASLEANQKLYQAPSYAQRMDQALVLYQGHESARTLLVTSHESLRQRLNSDARELLKEQGFLSGETYKIQSLQRMAFSNEQKRHAHLYQLGDVLRFSRMDAGVGITKDSYWTIKEIDLKTGLLSLENKEQVIILWDPAKAPVSANGVRSVEVFRPIEREVGVGETIVWTRSFRDQQHREGDRLKNQRALVVGVQGNTLQVLLPNGKTVLHDTSNRQGQHWDYGYALNLKQLSLHTVDTLIVIQTHAMETRSLEAFSELFKSAEKGDKTIHWITDDRAKLEETIEKGGLSRAEGTPVEQPYTRFDALSESPIIITQSVFSGLQGAYLKAREVNPEFFPHNLANPKSEPSYSPELRVACDTLERVCLYQAERQAVLSMNELQEQVALLGGARLSYKNLLAAFEIAFEKGWLVKVPDYELNPQVVCRHTLFLEKFCVQTMLEGKNQLTPLIPSDAPLLQALQENSTFTQGQKAAIHLVMSTPDRMVVIQGIAGSGKTTALKEIHQLCQSVDTQPLIIANTGGAKNQAKQQYEGIQAMTAAQFLTRLEGAVSRDRDQAKKEFKHALVIVDESSMISSHQLARLEKIVIALEIHLALFGDFKQIGSIGSGTSLYDALAYGVNKALMNENVRLSSPLALEAMKQTYQGDIRGAFRTLKDSIEEIPNKIEALEKMMKVYAALNPSGRPDFGLVTPLNADRDIVNAGVRVRLKEQGELQGNALSMRVLLPIDQREVTKQSIHGYRVQEVLRFNIDQGRMSVKAGDYATILEVDGTYHRLKLKLENGQECYWSPKNMQKTSDVEVYEQSSRELIKDDTIIFRRNHEALRIFNGDNATVVQVEANTFEVRLFNGQIVRLNAEQSAHQHLDYGYAFTPNMIQSRNIPFILAYGVSFKPWTKAREDLAVGDRIALPREDQGHPDLALVDTKLVRITALEPSAVHVRDAAGKTYVMTQNLDRTWEYYPPPDYRKPREFPLAMSQQQFLVTISRGNGFCVIVACIDDFQRILQGKEKHQTSALSHFDPTSAERDKGVQRLLATIQGKAERTAQKSSLLALPAPTHSKQHPSSPANNPSLRQSPKTFARIDVDALNHRLESDLLGYATQLLGKPKKVNSTDARWPGTLSLKLKGDKAGAWARWSTGDKGYGLVSLYKVVHGVSWKESLKAMAAMCGLSPEMTQHTPPSPKRSPIAQRNVASEEAAKQERIQWAQTVYKSGIPVVGTLAEKYLREHRSIQGALPEDFRYSPALKHLDTKQLTPALMAPLRDKDHRITGMVRIFLNADGSKLEARYKDDQGQWQKATTKANLGIAEHSGVIVQQGQGTLWVAEGIETALSIAEAMPHQKVMASTSVDRLRTIPVGPEIHTVVLCADKDEAGSQTFKSLIKAVEHHLSQDKKVFIAMPQGAEKCDFNDLMQQGGVLAVKEALDRRVEIKDLQMLRAGGIEGFFEKQQAVLQRNPVSSEPTTASQVQQEKTMTIEIPKQPLKGLDQERER